MTTKTAIITSAATCLVVHFLLWLLGWLVWPLAFLGLWIGAGHLSWVMQKNFDYGRDKDFISKSKPLHYLGGIVWMVLSFLEYSGEILSKYKLPSIRNPFVWTKDDN